MAPLRVVAVVLVVVANSESWAFCTAARRGLQCDPRSPISLQGDDDPHVRIFNLGVNKILIMIIPDPWSLP